jgi:hypothetical protein
MLAPVVKTEEVVSDFRHFEASGIYCDALPINSGSIPVDPCMSAIRALFTNQTEQQGAIAALLYLLRRTAYHMLCNIWRIMEFSKIVMEMACLCQITAWQITYVTFQ